MKKRLAVVCVCVCVMMLFLVGCNTESTNRQNEIMIIGVNDFDEDLFIKAIGRHHFSPDDYVDISLNWDGDGRVIFLSSTSGLSENNISELIESSIFLETTEMHGIVSAGAIRTINDEETMLEFAYSSTEIRWKINFSPANNYIGSHGYRYLYIITDASMSVSNMVGNIEFNRGSVN